MYVIIEGLGAATNKVGSDKKEWIHLALLKFVFDLYEIETRKWAVSSY